MTKLATGGASLGQGFACSIMMDVLVSGSAVKNAGGYSCLRCLKNVIFQQSNARQHVVRSVLPTPTVLVTNAVSRSSQIMEKSVLGLLRVWALIVLQPP
ncbi:hypothetical protein TNCV_860901 [Trichonephila clavipes]|nr:hypothetical protein TNCV_860901 [Trichonephila clavipes]